MLELRDSVACYVIAFNVAPQSYRKKTWALDPINGLENEKVYKLTRPATGPFISFYRGMLIDGQKWACEACIRGHRVSSCKHHGTVPSTEFRFFFICKFVFSCFLFLSSA